MGFNHGMAVGVEIFSIVVCKFGSSGLVAQTLEHCTHGAEKIAASGRLAVMNLAIRGITADYVLANPPFTDSDWFRRDDGVRWHEPAAERDHTPLSKHSKRLVDTLPYPRNALVHGSSELHEAAAASVHICAELINKLFTEPPPPPGIAGATG